jgi:Mn2+/Fe2+ NRAMP family transporter
VVGATVVNVSFLTLGAELLRPLGVIPEGIRVAEDLAGLLSQVWGPAGGWVLVTGIFVALWGSILANQDGWGRMYADATLMFLPRSERGHSVLGRPLPMIRLYLRNTYILTVLTAVPIFLFLLLRDPVDILSLAGIISAAHLPVVVTLTLYLNLRHLPKGLRPGPIWTAATLVAILFYGFFSAFFFYNLLRSG